MQYIIQHAEAESGMCAVVTSGQAAQAAQVLSH